MSSEKESVLFLWWWSRRGKGDDSTGYVPSAVWIYRPEHACCWRIKCRWGIILIFLQDQSISFKDFVSLIEENQRKRTPVRALNPDPSARSLVAILTETFRLCYFLCAFIRTYRKKSLLFTQYHYQTFIALLLFPAQGFCLLFLADRKLSCASDGLIMCFPENPLTSVSVLWV